MFKKYVVLQGSLIDGQEVKGTFNGLFAKGRAIRYARRYAQATVKTAGRYGQTVFSS